MHVPTLRAAGSILLGVGIGCAPSRSVTNTAQPNRYIQDGVLVSRCLPPLRFQAGPGFWYLGAHPFRIRNLAAGERHVFADTAGGRVRRLLLLQFEGYLEGVEGSYNYRTTNPVHLGGETYNQNLYFFDAGTDLAPEGAATRAFLDRQKLSWPREQMMSRFVRVVDAARRNELIIFYLESVADAGYTLAQVAASLTARSLRAFTVLEPEGIPPCSM
jgi:hypothetical protein